MDLSAVFSKTPKGLRARASLIGGLSSHLMKVLTHVDGTAKADTILSKFENLSLQQLSTDLKRLEQEGYIRLATVTANSDDGWALTTNFTPMVVEEFQSEAELEATTEAQNEAQARLDAEQKAKLEQDRQLAAAFKAEKKAQKLRDKEKTKAEVKVKAQLAQERLTEEKVKLAEAARIKAEDEARLKAQHEAARIAKQQAAERAAKLEEETRQKADLKAREAAEQAQEDAEVAAKESARREIERISREAEEAQNKADAEIKAKQEAARVEALALAKANEEARLQAQRKAEAEAQAAELAQAQAEQAKLKLKAEAKADAEALQAKIKATAEAELQAIQAREDALALAKVQEMAEKAFQVQKAEQAAKEKARYDIANVLRKAEQDRKNAVAQAKAEKLEDKRRAKAEQEARAQAERKAKDDAKELAKELAKQQKLTAQAEQKAQTEAARIIKQQELARAKAQESELQKAHIEAQLKQKQQAEAEQEAQLQMEQKTQQVADAMRNQLAAEEKASIDAKENVRLEMERIGREADIARQATVAQQHVLEVKENVANQTSKAVEKQSLPELEPKLKTNLDDFDAAEAAEEAAFQAEEQAQEKQAQEKQTAKAEKQTQQPVNKAANKAAIKLEKTAQQATEDAGRSDIKNAAKAEAEVLASIHANTKSVISAKKIKQWLASMTKVTFIYVPVLLLLLVTLAHFINLSALIKPIEQLASDSIGEPVVIKKVHASIWPQPHLVLQNVTIGANNIDAKINIKNIHVQPVSASLFEQVKQVKSLVVEGLTIEQANFDQPLQWISRINAAKNLNVAQINIKDLTLTIRDLQLETFDGKVTLTDTGAHTSIDLVSSNNALTVMITPTGNDYAIALKAANWALPFNQKLMFSTLTAKGVASNSQLALSQIEGEIFGGNLTATASIQWPNGANPNVDNKWQSTGKFKLANASAEQLLNTFGSEVQIDGKLALNGNFSNKASTAKQLAAASIVSADFDVRQGGVKGIELARAVVNRSGQSLAGNTTSFDVLTGTLSENNGQYQFAKLQLDSPQFYASGNVKIAKNQAVTGRFSANLAAQSRRLQANFGVTGRGKDLKSN